MLQIKRKSTQTTLAGDFQNRRHRSSTGLVKLDFQFERERSTLSSSKIKSIARTRAFAYKNPRAFGTGFVILVNSVISRGESVG